MPERDADGSAANLLVELIVTALSRRLAALTAPKAVVQTPEAQKEAQTQEAQSQGAALAESEPAQSSESSTLIAEATAGDSSSNSSS
jgi:hypothetical protein